MKKAFALLLAVLMLMSLAACSGGTSSGSTPAASGSAAPASSSAGNGETVKVVITLPSMNNLPSEEAKQAVSDALSEYVQGLGYNIAIDVQPYSLVDYTTDMNMRLAGGEELDIIYTGPINTAVTNGYLVNLDEYRDNVLAEAMKVVGDWDLCGTVNGSLYGIPAYKGLSLDYKYIYNEEYFKDFDMTQIKSINDLDGLFAHGCCRHLLCHCRDSTELVSLFDTAAYKKAAEKAYEWRQKGYVDPEGSAQTLTHDVLSQSGACKGVYMGHAYSVPTIEQMFTMNNTYGATFKAVSIGKTSLTSNTLTYGIAYTSKHPKEAAEVLNLIWTDEYVMSTLIYGLEGVSWEWNADKSSIQYPEGLGLDSVPYTCLFSCGAFGNQFLLYGMDGNTSNEDKEYMKELIDSAWVAPLFGFTPNSDNVSTQVAAVSNVYNQYDKALMYGDVDPASYLPEFQAALEAAGINDILADYQAQVDAWVEQYK